ncbi:Rieske 2Fe-2S domain-containing protein [Sphingomonas sp. MG17]|uniref:Rieske 2Fe-2S domain-containing protein n=1 Tax=Sphingomonas tagetis TaxID=2949092 RepID=A0A9X2HMF6_9SPHN|nr:Rieske 2Fe-2S domain-containing protein [Sphingomonas tagetis]MCP3730023.1 Rieske 2Fe-2S domain-containing protein [Sphingomonas tagetis]
MKPSSSEGSAYHFAPGQSDLAMTQVGRGTPAGEMLRRYWHPIAASAEVGDLPVAVRLLGEDLILFRTRVGEVGLVYPRCIHRGASLYYGRVEERGIRCCYHGWLFAPTGQCLEQVCEPDCGARTVKHYRQPWYPVEERYGVIFAYLGPLEEKPPLPRYEPLENLEDGQYRLIVDAHHKVFGDPQPDYNWLQMTENGVDPFHVYVLHNLNRDQFHPSFGIRPEVRWEPIPHGVRTSTLRRDQDHVVHRVGELIFPLLTVSGNPLAHDFDKSVLFVWKVPVDDHNTRNIIIFRASDRVAGLVESGEFERQLFPRSWHDMTEEEHQRDPGDYEAQKSQGPITLHTEENLVSSDKGVALYRRMLKQAITDVAAGKSPFNMDVLSNRPVRIVAGNFLDDRLQAALDENAALAAAES